LTSPVLIVLKPIEKTIIMGMQINVSDQVSPEADFGDYNWAFAKR